MLYAYAIRYASRCSASLAIISYHVRHTRTHTALLRYRIVSQQQQLYIPGNTSTMHTYHNRKGKSFFHDPESDRGLGHFKVVSVGGLRFQNSYITRYFRICNTFFLLLPYL